MEWSKSSAVTTTELYPAQDSEEFLRTYNHPQYIPAEEWPTRPTPLRRSLKSRILSMLYDLGLISVCLILMTKVGLVIVVWYHDRDHHGSNISMDTTASEYIIDFNAQLVTAWGVLFGLMVGTFIKRYALWKAQKGAYVRELEQLHGSTSLTSTLKLIFSLRAGVIMSMSLVTIWSFYYLGSQASQREYSFAVSDPYYDQEIAVSDIYRPSIFDSTLWTDPNSKDSPWKINELYREFDGDWDFVNIKDGFPLTQKAGTDMYGVSLVPNIHTLQHWINRPSSNDSTDWRVASQGDDGWVDLYDIALLQQTLGPNIWVSRSTLDFYTSHFNEKGEPKPAVSMMLGSYQYPMRYFSVGCGYPWQQAYEDFPNGTLGSTTLSFNMTPTSPEAPTDLHGNPLRSFEYWTRWRDTTAASEDGTVETDPGFSVVMPCNITSTVVDVKVSCTEAGCSADRVRLTNGTSPQQATNYSTPFDDDAFASRFLAAFSASTLVSDTFGAGYSPVLDYLNASDPTQPATSLSSDTDLDSGPISYANGDPSDTVTHMFYTDFITTLNNLLNTFYTTSQHHQYVPVDMRRILASQPSPPYMAITFHGAPWDPRFEISWAWIAVDFAACLVLLSAACAATFFRLATCAPDIFGYVSSLTRDNPHVRAAVPDSGTGLDGLDRARMMKDVKVRIGDVSGGTDGVARVGLAVVKIRDVGGMQLQPGRLRPEMKTV